MAFCGQRVVFVHGRHQVNRIQMDEGVYSLALAWCVLLCSGCMQRALRWLRRSMSG